MELAELQSELVDGLRPGAGALAGRCPEFAELVVRRLVERTPQRYPAVLFENESDREEFVAGVSLEGVQRRIVGLGSIWLVLLIQVLLPALVRVFLLWWSCSPRHRADLLDLQVRLAAAPPVAPRRRVWLATWRQSG